MTALAATATQGDGPRARSSAAPAGSRLFALLGLAGGLTFAFTLWNVSGGSYSLLIGHLRSAQTGPLVFAAFGALVLTALQSLRWWVAVRAVAPVTLWQAIRGRAMGNLFNALLPARGGDLVRARYVGALSGAPTARILGTQIVDLCGDKFGWLVAFGVVCLAGEPPAALRLALLPMAGALVLLAAAVALMGSGLGRSNAKLWKWVHSLRDGFDRESWKRLLLLEVVVGPLPWMWEALVVLVSARAVGLHLGPAEAFGVLTAFNLAMAVPTPGNVGTMEGGGALALVQLGAAPETAFAFMVLYHLVQIVPNTCAGALVLLQSVLLPEPAEP